MAISENHRNAHLKKEHMAPQANWTSVPFKVSIIYLFIYSVRYTNEKKFITTDGYNR